MNSLRITIPVLLALLVGDAGSETGNAGPVLRAQDSAGGQQVAGTEHPLEGYPRKLEAKHLPNLIRLHEKVFSGGLPAGEAAFRELQELGVRTIVSVDGARPDFILARQFGLRYVHLPHGYDGIPPERVVELARAVRDLDGPVYVHCHHGKHRSPAASAVACVAAGMINAHQAQRVLQIAGTDPNYIGLFRSIANARLIDKQELDAYEVRFPEVSELPPMAEAMVGFGETFDHLKRVFEAGWRSPASHPDLNPDHEALMLREHFTEMLRADYVMDKPPGFLELLREGEGLTRQLESELRQRSAIAGTDRIGSGRIDSDTSLTRQFRAIESNCTDCHRRFRDVPDRNQPYFPDRQPVGQAGTPDGE